MTDSTVDTGVAAASTDATTQAGAAAAAATPTTQTAAPVASWRDNIQDSKVKEFASKFTSEADLATAALQFRQKLSNALVIPGKDAQPEDIADFRKKLGVPEKAEGYEFAVPDSIPDDIKESHVAELKEFAGVFHELGVPKQVAEGVIAKFHEKIAAQIEEGQAARERAFQDAESALRKEWGGDFERNLAFAHRAYEITKDPEFNNIVKNATFEGKPMASHPAFQRYFAILGRRMGEGDIQLPMDASQKEAADQQVNELTQKIYEANQRGDAATVNRLDKQRSDLIARLAA